MILLHRELQGKILDIGGGGEGIIGRLYQNQVIAIDNRQEELDDAPNGFEKIWMDATDLQFDDASFDNVTFFFSLMFMDAADQQKAICEAARVLKTGGKLCIWDCDIASAYPDPFCIDLEIQLPEERISTTYGIGKLDSQSYASISGQCRSAGLTPVKHDIASGFFYLVFTKTACKDTDRCSSFWFRKNSNMGRHLG